MRAGSAMSPKAGTYSDELAAPSPLVVPGLQGGPRRTSVLTRKSGGEWAGRRQPGGAGSCCAAVGLGSGGGVGDDRFAVADGDVLAGERLELGGQVAGAAVFVDPGFVVAGPEVTKCGVGV